MLHSATSLSLWCRAQSGKCLPRIRPVFRAWVSKRLTAIHMVCLNNWSESTGGCWWAGELLGAGTTNTQKDYLAGFSPSEALGFKLSSLVNFRDLLISTMSDTEDNVKEENKDEVKEEEEDEKPKTPKKFKFFELKKWQAVAIWQYGAIYMTFRAEC